MTRRTDAVQLSTQGLDSSKHGSRKSAWSSRTIGVLGRTAASRPLASLGCARAESVKSKMKCFAIVLMALLLVGCTKTWEKVSAPDIHGSNALASVFSFIATNGWDTHARQTNDLIFWADEERRLYISGLPWKKWSGQSFPALTSRGILYVLLGDAFHGDYYGVAYNPNTNHFPEWIRGFKPIGGHWYVWAQPEFWYSAKTDGRYE
jgi:hypothetical protein